MKSRTAPAKSKNKTRQHSERQNIAPESTVEYPYLVIRLQAAVYDKRRIVFAQTPGASDGHAFLLQWPQSFDRTRALPSAVRLALIEQVKGASKQSGFRMCIVVSQDESLYVEPDGRVESMSTAPSGGIALSLGAAALAPRTRSAKQKQGV